MVKFIVLIFVFIGAAYGLGRVFPAVINWSLFGLPGLLYITVGALGLTFTLKSK